MKSILWGKSQEFQESLFELRFGGLTSRETKDLRGGAPERNTPYQITLPSFESSLRLKSHLREGFSSRPVKYQGTEMDILNIPIE